MDFQIDYTQDLAVLSIKTNHGGLEVTLADIGIEGTEVTCCDMDKVLLVQRLPEELTETQLAYSGEIEIPAEGDSAIFARAMLKDGHVAWTIPISSSK